MKLLHLAAMLNRSCDLDTGMFVDAKGLNHIFTVYKKIKSSDNGKCIYFLSSSITTQWKSVVLIWSICKKKKSLRQIYAASTHDNWCMKSDPWRHQSSKTDSTQTSWVCYSIYKDSEMWTQMSSWWESPDTTIQSQYITLSCLSSTVCFWCCYITVQTSVSHPYCVKFKSSFVIVQHWEKK